MANERAKIAMSEAEMASFIAGNRKMQLATINRDGTPHLVTMFYAVIDGRVAFWTYRSSQKALNILRDARVTVLIEDGIDYFELRGVQINGVAEPTDVLTVGRLVGQGIGEGLDEFIEYTARKRLAWLVSPTRVSSWNHAKLVAT